MLLKFPYATFLALAGLSGTDALIAPKSQPTRSSPLHVGAWDNEDFLNALSAGGTSKPDNNEEVSEGGSRFKEILEKAKQKQQQGGSRMMPRVIENPFLTPPPPPVQLGVDPDALSVEDQARMFREMMQAGQSRPAAIPATQRVSKTDRAGRPVGRNRDADTIANASDLYFAQLKRDSTVRGLARIRGDYEEAEKVFEDEGIKLLDSLLVENPYLKGQKDATFFETVPEEALRPFLDKDELSEDEVSTSGISYKEMLKRRKQKKSGSGAGMQSTKPQEPVPEVARVPPAMKAERIVETPTLRSPSENVSVQGASAAPPAEPAAVVSPTSSPSQPSAISGSEETRQKLRTLMGLLLKHRGGPGFGTGRLMGPEIEKFDSLLQEVTSVLRNEASNSAALRTGTIAQATQEIAVAPTPVLATASQSLSGPAPPSDMGQLDSTVACIEGAVTMYKNSPPELRESVLVTLRAALVAAVKTCNSVLGDTPSLTASSATVQMESTIACIEGAVTMYKSSPPELKQSVLLTMRGALMLAINGCNSIIGDGSVSFQSPATVKTHSAPVATATDQAASSASATTSVTAPQSTVPALGTDPNSKKLERIYMKMKAAAGDGGLGLRSDLTSAQASELADQLEEMRGILMEELDAGIPDPEPEELSTVSTVATGGSSVSKYQQMLAKARAEKEANAS